MQNGKANPEWCERDAEGAAENGLGAPYRAAKDAVRLRRKTTVIGSGYGSTRRGSHREVRAKQGGNTEAAGSRPWMERPFGRRAFLYRCAVLKGEGV